MKKTTLFILGILFTLTCSARVTLPGIYTSHMVLQQRSQVILNGQARANKTVTLKASWCDTLISTKADQQGCFTMRFATPPAGGPYTLRFSDGQALTLSDVYVGEVWLGSGQSNMEMPLAGWGKILNYEKEIASASFPLIRLYQVQRRIATMPVDQVSSTLDGWQPCSPQTIPEFSALAYCFARELQQNLNVPIGIINSSWGGTPGESWTSLEAVSQVMGFQELMAQARALGFDSLAMRERYDAQYAQWYDDCMRVDKGSEGWERTDWNDSEWGVINLPSNFDNTDNVLPLFDGVVWHRVHITIPSGWEKKTLTLHLGCIDDEDRVYINGQFFTSTSGWDTPRTYTIPAGWFHAGDNVLAIRVLDTGGGGGIYGDGKDMTLSCDKGSICLNGYWKYKVGCDFTAMPEKPLSPFGPHFPASLFNGMIAPLTDFPLAGVIWYQGCNNVGRDQQYKALFPTLIADWRQQFNNPAMPFYFVQLANYLTPSDLQPESEWAMLREAQDAALALPNVYRVTNIELGEAYDIHPKNKQEVARRMALLALRHTYGKQLNCAAPEYKGYRIEGNRVFIELNRVDGAAPLMDQNNAPGFIIAGPDWQWHVAQATCKNNQIVVYSDDVSFPVAVRYGWADNPTCTLKTADGIPLAPFRTDK